MDLIGCIACHTSFVATKARQDLTQKFIQWKQNRGGLHTWLFCCQMTSVSSFLWIQPMETVEIWFYVLSFELKCRDLRKIQVFKQPNGRCLLEETQTHQCTKFGHQKQHLKRTKRSQKVRTWMNMIDKVDKCAQQGCLLLIAWHVSWWNDARKASLQHSINLCWFACTISVLGTAVWAKQIFQSF